MSRTDELRARAASSAPSRHSPDSPPRIPDHEMVRLIGSGSYGEVWLARNAVGTWRAVKVVYRDRFKERHPYEREFVGIQKYEPISRTNEGLVDVLQIGRNEAEGYFYYVMELADDAAPRQHDGVLESQIGGRDLAVRETSTQAILHYASYIPRTLNLDLIRRGRLSFEECVTLGLTLNLALGYLHRNGLIHRDVKPPNIIYVNGVPKLADIGLVTEVSGANSFVGTEGYVAPEGPNSPQADLYALGKVLYEASMGKDRLEFPKKPTGLGLDPDSKNFTELHAVVLRACASNPKLRYRSAEEMNADLALLHSGKSVKQKHAVERRLKLTTRVAVVAVALLVLGVFPYYLAIKKARAARIASREARDSEQKAGHAQVNEARARATAEQRLYDSLLGEARATRLARRVGYRDKVFALLAQASDLEVQQRNLAELRREAGACLGDFVGLMPTTFADFPANATIRRAALDPAGQSAAFVLEGGIVQLRRMPSGTETGRFQLGGDLPTKSVCFDSTGNQLVFVLMPGDLPSGNRLEDRFPHARLCVWNRGPDNQWRETENTPLPGALDCLSTTRGVFVTAYSNEPRLGRLIDASTRRVVHEFEIPDSWIPEVTLSPDGQLLVTEMTEPAETDGYPTSESRAQGDSILNVWNLRTGQRVARLTPQRGMLRSLAFSAEGNYLMCSSKTSGGVIYEVGGFQRATEFDALARDSLVFAPGGRLVAMPRTQDNRVRIWDWISQEEYAVLDEAKPAHKIAFAPDGSFLLTVSLRHARLYLLDQTPEKLKLRRHSGNMPGVTFVPDNSEDFRIATAGLSPAVRVSDATTGREIWKYDALPIQCHAPVFSPFSPEGRWLATGDFDSPRIILWDAQTPERLLVVPTAASERRWSVQISPDGRYLATGSSISRTNEFGIELWAVDREQTGEGASSLRATPLKGTGCSAWSLVFAPDGRSLAYVDRDRKGVFVWEFKGQSAPRCLSTNLIHGIGNGQSLSFTPDSRRLMMVDDTRAVLTLYVATGKVASSFSTIDPKRTPEWTFSAGICLSPDGTKLAMVSASGRGVDIWNPDSGQLLYSLPEQDGTVYWQAWSRNGQLLAISRVNGEIAVWRLKEVEQVMARLGLDR